ncbi:hypothetical protein LAZ67_X000731 [Cordylochernes scorpioides]|uniref:Retrovirus-related Pol polyprotein from transposon TNT 1-94 n=1 Tax=Cordylochernes scorpioides TaxID=51811 RepID=A0ABY6LWQ5_9ARAC|nr:hypothetical protein LAZ67_X000731 [Cordylochernes scorpioides]
MNESMKEYIARIMNIHRKLDKGGHGFKDTELALIMLMGLPKTYEPMILNLEQNKEKLSTKIVKAKLLLEEKRQLRHDTIEEETTSRAFVIKEEKQPTFHERRKYHPAEKTQEASTSHNYQKNTQAKAVKCFCCGKMGYIAKKCRFNPAVKERFCFTENKGTSEENVLIVPEIEGILLSVGIIEKLGNTVYFENGNVKVLNQQGELLVTAPRNGNTYYIEEFNNSARITKVREDIWHRRLGHLNKEAVAKMNIREKRSDNQCTESMESKMKKLPFSIYSNKNKRASYPLELIHSDVVGPINPRSKGGSNYFVTFIDDFSHYTVVYFMKNKNEVMEKFKEYKNFVENFHERRIRHCDLIMERSIATQILTGFLSKMASEGQLSVPRTLNKMRYPEGTKGYKVWDFRNDKIYVTRNVRFSEDIFPCKKPNDPTKSFELDQFSTTSEEEDFYEEKLIHQRDQQTKMNDRNLCAVRKELRKKKGEETKIKCDIMKNPQPSTEEPSTIEEALCGPEATNWSEAIQRELQGLEEKGAWEIVPRPVKKRVIDSRWVFKRKFDSYGNLREYRARLVARGFHQIPNVDFGKKYSPVIKHKSIRFLLALAVVREWNIFQMDVKSAYLNAPLHETVYMELPESSLNHENFSNEVCLLKKSIYGLKQSGHEWKEKLDQILTSIGLERSRMDPCVYFSKDIILGVYVDDLLVTTSSVESYVKFKSSIQREVDIKDLGEVSDLLSVRIKRNKDSNLELDQTHYIEEILKEYGMEHAKEASTPLDPGMFTEGPGGKEACRMTRPDIAYAVSYLSKFNSSPLQQHWNAVKHLLRYLKKTKDLKLVFSKTGKKLVAFADADWGSDKEDRKSYSGHIFVLGGAAISWCSRKQKCVALSTAEAEYYAMCKAAKEALCEPSYCLPGFGGGPAVVNPTPPIEQFLAQRGFWERGDELQYASLEHPTHALLDSGPEIWLANPSFEYSHSGDIH